MFYFQLTATTVSSLSQFPPISFRALMGVVENISAAEVSQLVNTSGVALVLSDLLSSKNGGRLVCPVCLTTLACTSSV